MSGAIRQGEGESEFAVYLCQRFPSRSLPLLRRNVRKVLRSLTMGSALSGMKTSVPARPREEAMAFEDEDEDDEDARPLKRRRMNPNNSGIIPIRPSIRPNTTRMPLDQVTNVTNKMAKASLSRPQRVEPVDFYGKPRNSSSDLVDVVRQGAVRTGQRPPSKIFPVDPVHFKQCLRLDILGIVPGCDSENGHFGLTTRRKRPITIKCRCSVAILYGDEEAVAPKDFSEICRIVKPCTLRITFTEDDRVQREFTFTEPYVFRPEDFFVNRKTQKSNGQWTSENEYERTFGFAEKYNIQIFIEGNGYHQDWPPINIPSLDEIGYSDSGTSLSPSNISFGLEENKFTKSDLLMYSETSGIFDPKLQTESLALQVCCRNPNQTQPVKYSLGVKMEWSVPNSLGILYPKLEKALKPLEAPEKSVDAAASSSRRGQSSPSKVLQEHTLEPNSPGDSRAQRRRNIVGTYNLKALSSLAQGRSPRKTLSTSGPGSGNHGITVTYSFGRADATEASIKQKHTTNGLKCIFCTAHISSVDELRLHLHHEHSSHFRFHLRGDKPPRIKFFVELLRQRNNPSMFMEFSRTIQLGKSRSLFDLEKYLSGNDPWTKARQGPQHNLWPQHLRDESLDSSMSSSPYASRQSSPNTSNDAEDFEQYEFKHKQSRKVYHVPVTSKPLYDTITKRVLQPGEVIPDSDDETDNSWLHLVHRDIINDFSDLTDSEKDYYHQWNPFIVDEHLTSLKYLPEAIMRFVEENKFWFAETPTRKAEFHKQMDMFILRGDADLRCFNKCMRMLMRAEEEFAARMDVDKREDEGKPRGLFDCVCGKPARPPDRVACHGLPGVSIPPHPPLHLISAEYM